MLTPRFVKTLFFASLALLVAAWFKGEPLPDREAVSSAMWPAPRQLATDKPPFPVTAGGVNYQIKPLYTYELNGLVVSRHDTETWWDFIHKEAAARVPQFRAKNRGFLPRPLNGIKNLGLETEKPL